MPVEQRGQVTLVRMESTGNRRNSLSWRKPAGFPRGDTSRMNREIHVRICGGLGVANPRVYPAGLAKRQGRRRERGLKEAWSKNARR